MTRMFHALQSDCHFYHELSHLQNILMNHQVTVQDLHHISNLLSPMNCFLSLTLFPNSLKTPNSPQYDIKSCDVKKVRAFSQQVKVFIIKYIIKLYLAKLCTKYVF